MCAQSGEKRQELQAVERGSLFSEVEWKETPRRMPGAELLKNMAVAAALVICAATLRSGALPALDPTTDAVISAVTGDTLLDEQLGKLSFVSTLFPEATLVFGEQTHPELALGFGQEDLVHVWSEQEPYVSYEPPCRSVEAVMDGEVTAVYHGNGEERIVQVSGMDNMAVLYGNLAECSVNVGDAICIGDTVGTLVDGAKAVLEVRRNGYAVDPMLVKEHAK